MEIPWLQTLLFDALLTENIAAKSFLTTFTGVCVCMCFKYVFATRYKKKVSSFSLLIDLFLKRIDRIHCTLQCTLNRRKGPLKRKIKHGSMHMCDESVNFVLILKRVKFSLFSVDSRTKTYHCIFLCMPFIIWKTSG